MTAAGRNSAGKRPSSEMTGGPAGLDDSVLDFARASGDWFWETDAKGRFTFISEQISEKTRLTPEDCLGKTREEIQCGRSFQNGTWGDYDNLLKARKPFRDFTFVHIGPDGVGVPIAISGVPVFKGRKFMGYRGTGRRAAQGEISEGLIRNIVTATSMGVGREFLNLVAVALCRELDVDQVFISQLGDDGRSVESLIAVVDGRRTPNFSYDLAGSPCEGVVGSQSMCVYSQGVASIFPDDPYLAEEGIEGYIGLPLHDSHGRCLGLMVALSRRPLVLCDLHKLVFEFFAGRVAAELDRALSEELLRSNQLLLASIIDNLPEVVTVKDTDGRYLFVNREFTERYGRRADEVAGRTSREVFPDWGATRDASEQQELGIAENGRVTVRSEERRFVDGSAHVLEIRKFPIRNTDGGLLAIGTLTMDTTERFTRDAEAAERERLVHSYRRALDAIVATASRNHRQSDPRFIAKTPHSPTGQRRNDPLGPSYRREIG